MTKDELFLEAISLLMGTNGYPKNEKKAWVIMKRAADEGHKEACARYAVKIMKSNCLAAAEYFMKNCAYDIFPDEFAECLYYCIKKTKNDDKNENDYYAWVQLGDSLYSADGYYYWALMVKIKEPENIDLYNKLLYYAALGNSKIMPDSLYKQIGRERGILVGKTEMDAYMSSNDNNKKVLGFGPVNKNEEQAWHIAVANLTEKGRKFEVSKSELNRLVREVPKGVLEYEYCIYCAYNVGTVTARYEYDNPNYTSVYRNSGTLKIDTYWYNYFAVYQTPQSQKDFYKVLQGIELQQTYKDARFRIFPYRCKEVLENIKERTLRNAQNGAVSKVKKAVHKENNWEEKYIKVDIDNYDISLYGLKEVYIPYWYFTISTGGKNTATVRVNAINGEVSTFSNNPFGQFTDYDDVVAGGKTKYSKEVQKEIKKRKNAKARKLNILLTIQCILTILLFLIGGWFVGIPLLLSVAAHVYFRFFKK